MTKADVLYRIPVYRLTMVKESNQISQENQLESSDPTSAYNILSAYLQGADREHFVILLLNAKNKVIGIHTVSIGTLNASLVHPREVFKPAILANAYSVVIAHNHPSGDPTPSREDYEVTKRLIDAGKLLGVEVLDHIVIGDGTYDSLRESGMVKF
jgi:DNA repair protein RadC